MLTRHYFETAECDGYYQDRTAERPEDWTRPRILDKVLGNVLWQYFRWEFRFYLNNSIDLIVRNTIFNDYEVGQLKHGSITHNPCFEGYNQYGIVKLERHEVVSFIERIANMGVPDGCIN